MTAHLCKRWNDGSLLPPNGVPHARADTIHKAELSKPCAPPFHYRESPRRAVFEPPPTLPRLTDVDGRRQRWSVRRYGLVGGLVYQRRTDRRGQHLSGGRGEGERASIGARRIAGASPGAPGLIHGRAGRAATNSLRRYLYQQVCPELEGRAVLPPASYDHYYGIESAIDYELLSREADGAAELGLEIFVLDAGWFKGSFPNGAGNWDEVDTTKLPDGLEPLADYVRELGMGFGLWFEPERAVEGTNIIRDHPEWFVPVDQPYYEPQNYNINLAIPGAQDYLIEMIGGWVDRLGLRWIRWDYNIDPQPLWEAVDLSGKAEHEFMAGLYRVLDTLMQNHPSLLIESCSSGGRRIDIGTMRRAHTYWFSDQTEDPLVCRYMQARANRFLPGHLLNSAVTVNRDQGDDGFDDTAVLSRMLGALAFNGDIASWSPDLTSRMRGWVDKFKEIRHLLVQDFYQLLPIPTTIDDWDAVQFVSDSRDEAVLFVFAGQQGGKMNILPLGLRDERRYRITRQPAGTPRTFSGSEVMAEGLQVRLGSHEGGLWHIVLDDPAGPR